MPHARQRSPAVFFDDAIEALDLAARRSVAWTQMYYLVGGRPLRIVFGSAALQRGIGRALAHLEMAAQSEPALTVFAWDSATSRLPPLQAGWPADAYGDDGEIAGFNDTRFHSVTQFEPLIFRMLDRERKRAIYWTPSANDLPDYERAAPLRSLLHEWLPGAGGLPLHGGAVGFPGGGILLVGSGGAGKSNAALACLRSPLLYASDDFCALSSGSEWLAHSMYSTGKLGSGDLVRFQHLVPFISNPQRSADEKAIFFLNEHFPSQLIRAFPVRAIVLPRVCPDEPSAIVPVSRAAAHKAIAISTSKMAPNHTALTFSMAARLVNDLPCFELRMGNRIEAIPALIGDLLARLPASRLNRAPS
jgi:hypothetical protein